MKKIGFILFSLVFAFPVLAQQPAVEGVRTTVTQEVMEIRETAREGIESLRARMRADVARRREEFKTLMDEQREKTKQRIVEKQKTLRERLQTIKEEKKRKIVEVIDARIDALNEQKTAHYASALDQMEAVLVRIEERINRAEAQGKDGAAARSAVVAAKNAIAAARSAVVTQAGKTYTIAVTTDEKLKNDVTRAREALKIDLGATFSSVKDARDLVHKAAIAFARMIQEEADGEQTATSTNAN